MQKGIIRSILFFTLTLLVFKNNTTLAQTEIEQKNLTLKDQKYFKDGTLFTGLMIVKYETGQTKEKIELKNGLYDGLYKEYNANGKLSKEFTYSHGNQEGEFKLYENGILTTKGNFCASCEDEHDLVGDLYGYENQKITSHFFIENNGTWYDRLNPNNPPVNPKSDLTERFKTILPASFTVTQDGVSFLMRLDKNGTGVIMMGQYGPDNLLWSIKNKDQLSVYYTAIKTYTTYKITYSSKTTQNPILEENSKGKIYYWNVKN